MRALSLFLSFVGLVFATDVAAQMPLIWEGQAKTTVQELWYSPEDLEGKGQLWTTRTVWHRPDGHPELVVVKGKEYSQRVNFRYDDRGDLLERIHRFPDSTVQQFTWKHRYDEQGRKVELTSFDNMEKLLGQEIRVYDDAGNLTDHAMYQKRFEKWESWEYLDDETGLKQHDATLVRYGSRNFRSAWYSQLFVKSLTPFSLMPPDDVFQRYKFHYNSETAKLTKTELFDPAGNVLEEDTCYYDGRGRLRSLISTMPMDQAKWVWDFKYDEQGNIGLARYVDTKDNAVTDLLRTSYTMEGDRIVEKTTLKIGAPKDIYHYGEDGSLEWREKRDLFGQVMSRFTYDDQSRIKELWRFNSDGDLDSVLKYSYE